LYKLVNVITKQLHAATKVNSFGFLCSIMVGNKRPFDLGIFFFHACA